MSNQDEPFEMRRQNSSNELPNKRHRQRSPDEPVEVTNIIDINDDCLEHIFKKLSFDGLLNVADSCKRLQNATRLAFTSKYGRHTVRLNGDQRIRSILMNDKQIDIMDKSSCLKVLRCFGASMTKLATLSLAYLHECDDMDRYLDEYCAESVVELEYGRVTLDNLKKQFTKVESVRFTNHRFHCHRNDINVHFPNLRVLELSTGLSPGKFLATLFPHLDTLIVNISASDHKKFELFLELNPQLRKLQVSVYDLNFKFLQLLGKCPQLESLNILYTPSKFTHKKFIPNKDPVQFESVKKFEIQIGYLRLIDQHVSIEFKQLDELTVHGDWNENVINLIKKNPFISTFIYHGNSRYIDRETMLLFANALPNVKRARFGWRAISTNSVIGFVNACPALEYFECKLRRRTENDFMKDLLDTKWQSFIDQYDFVKLQR